MNRSLTALHMRQQGMTLEEVGDYYFQRDKTTIKKLQLLGCGGIALG